MRSFSDHFISASLKLQNEPSNTTKCMDPSSLDRQVLLVSGRGAACSVDVTGDPKFQGLGSNIQTKDTEMYLITSGNDRLNLRDKNYGIREHIIVSVNLIF